MTTNQNHPDDHLAIEALHSRYLDVLTGRTSDHLLMFQDEAYALGRARGRLDVFRFDLHLERQRRFSERTFGPGSRAAGVIDHIRKELREIDEAPGDLAEWIDVVILALDGAWRTGATPAQIIDALVAKQTKNESRTWPDWRTVPVEKAIEHDRTGDAPAVAYSDPRSGKSPGAPTERTGTTRISQNSSPATTSCRQAPPCTSERSATSIPLSSSIRTA